MNLNVLEAAFAKLEKLGKDEETFYVEDIPVTLRIMSSTEHDEATEMASTALEDIKDADDRYQVSDAFGKMARLFRIHALAASIVKIGSLDLSGVEFVEVGEDENGRPIKQPRSQAIRPLIERWGPPLQARVYTKYVALVERMEKRVEAAIKFEPADIDLEIDRLRAQIERLEEKRKLSLSYTDQLRQQGGMSLAEAEPTVVFKTAPAEPVEPPPAPKATTPLSGNARAVGKREPLVPKEVAPPPTAFAPSIPSNVPPPPKARQEMDSFIDASDPDQLQEANLALFRQRQLRANNAPVSVRHTEDPNIPVGLDNGSDLVLNDSDVNVNPRFRPRR
jgi:hypothetical protein